MDSREDNEVIKLPPTLIFKVITVIRNFLYNLYFKFVPANVAVFEKAQRFWIAKALGVACELNIADIIDSEPTTINEIAEKSGTLPQPLYRLMRALASDGIFKETEKQVFVNTPLSKALTEGKGSMKYMIQHQLNETNWEIINELSYSLKTGKSAARKLLGTDIFGHLQNHLEKNELYNKAMTNTSDISSAAFVSAYDFSGIENLIDIGGGEGYLLSMVLKKYKKMQGIVFDLPHVVKTAAENFIKFGIENRATAEAGNFFDKIPKGGDAYILKNILHAFDDEVCVKILKSIQESINPDGKLLIIETVIGEDNKPAYGKIFDLQMLLVTDGGKERTRKEFEEIFSKADFKLNRVVDTVSPFSIVEGVPV